MSIGGLRPTRRHSIRAQIPWCIYLSRVKTRPQISLKPDQPRGMPRPAAPSLDEIWALGPSLWKVTLSMAIAEAKFLFLYQFFCRINTFLDMPTFPGVYCLCPSLVFADWSTLQSSRTHHSVKSAPTFWAVNHHDKYCVGGSLENFCAYQVHSLQAVSAQHFCASAFPPSPAPGEAIHSVTSHW